MGTGTITRISPTTTRIMTVTETITVITMGTAIVAPYS
jgi:hypothetical protein